MALNLTPEYFEADRKYRQAPSREEKLAALEEMLRVIPKHKASEKKQSDLKRKISELRKGEGGPKKKGGAPDPYHIEPQGAGQACLFGMPNSGKSSIVAKLTNAPVKVTDFPFGTPMPVPGMAYHEDVPIELVDMPPVTPEHLPGNMINCLRNTNAVLFVADLTANSVLEDVEALLGLLADRGIEFEPPEEAEAGDDDATDEEARHMMIEPHGLIVCTKFDCEGAADTFEVLKELGPKFPPMMAVSAETGEGLPEMLATLFGWFNVIRVYSKEPGKPADKQKPFILPTGSTVEELARTIHKDIAASLRFARIWGDHGHPGQQVQKQHELFDKDVVELHA